MSAETSPRLKAACVAGLVFFTATALLSVLQYLLISIFVGLSTKVVALIALLPLGVPERLGALTAGLTLQYVMGGVYFSPLSVPGWVNHGLAMLPFLVCGAIWGILLNRQPERSWRYGQALGMGYLGTLALLALSVAPMFWGFKGA